MNPSVHPGGPPGHAPAETLPGSRLAVFVSGTGRTLVNLVERRARGEFAGQVVLVVASRPCRGEAFARERGIPTRRIDPRAATPDSLGAMLREARADWVVLAGYLHLLPIPTGYEGRVVNIHPALLPSFGGPGMYGHHVHEAVLASGAAESGCTVHLCDGRYDRGVILAQRRCPVIPGDTPDALAARVFELELDLLPGVLGDLIARGGPPPDRTANPPS